MAFSSLRVMSGIQPTGIPHLGNFFGALRLWAQLLETRTDRTTALFSIVDLHALTTINKKQLRGKPLHSDTRNMAACVLASGIDPKKCVLFRQSDIPEHTALSWVLGCSSPLSPLMQMTQFKDKKQKKQMDEVSLGLLSYPVLQAADILLYKANLVPVGEDQTQHLELCRKIARRVNKLADREIFPVPRALIGRHNCRVMSLHDASVKMSKSHPLERSRINLSDSDEEIKTKISRAKTDGEPGISYDHQSRPGISNLVDLYAACLMVQDGVMQKFSDVDSDVTERYVGQVVDRCESYSAQQFKGEVTDALVEVVGPISREIRRLNDDEGYVDQVLLEGGLHAQDIATDTWQDVRSGLKMI